MRVRACDQDIARRNPGGLTYRLAHLGDSRRFDRRQVATDQQDLRLAVGQKEPVGLKVIANRRRAPCNSGPLHEGVDLRVNHLGRRADSKRRRFRFVSVIIGGQRDSRPPSPGRRGPCRRDLSNKTPSRH